MTSVDQAAFIRRAKSLHPALQPSSCHDGLGHSPDRDHTILAGLLDALRREYAAAGHRYWSTRLWQLTTWQPVYLAVAAADSGYQLNFRTLRQAVRSLSVYGYALERSDPGRDHAPLIPAPRSRSRAIAANARALRCWVDDLFMRIGTLTPLSRGNSYALVADTLTYALLAAPGPAHPRCTRLGLSVESSLWCTGAGLVNRRREPLSGITSSRGQPAVARGSCCRHHLTCLDGADYCQDCPLPARRSAESLATLHHQTGSLPT